MATFEPRMTVAWSVSCAAQPTHNRTFKQLSAAERHVQRLNAMAFAGVRLTKQELPAWSARIRLTGFPHISKTFSTRRAAEDWARVKEGEIAKRQFVDHRLADRISLSDLLRSYDTKELSSKPADHPDRSRVRTLCKLPLAQIRMSSLTSQDFAEYRDKRVEQVKNATVTKELELCTRVINIARQEGGLSLASNPASSEQVRRPKVQDERNRRLKKMHSFSPVPLEPACRRKRKQATSSSDHEPRPVAGWAVPAWVVDLMGNVQTEEQLILRALRYPHWFQPCKPNPSADREKERAWRSSRQPKIKARDRKGAQYWRVFSFGVETALRRGEQLKLRWEHVSLEVGCLMLPGSITKNTKARVVPLSRRATRILVAQALAHGKSPLPDDPVFGFSTSALKQGFERGRARAGAAGLRFHDLRHEATSRLFEKTTLRDSEIGSITGHTDPRMLERYNNRRAGEFVERFHASFNDAKHSKQSR